MAYPLYEYAYAPLDKKVLEQVAQLAQPEGWDYRAASSTNPKPILFNYLQNTFARAQEQGRLGELPGCACFNTGLVTNNYEQIFAYFTPNKLDKPIEGKEQKWKLQDFLKESDHRLFAFDELPQMATYFDNPADLLYDTRVQLRPNIDHIIDDNRDRFPKNFEGDSKLIN